MNLVHYFQFMGNLPFGCRRRGRATRRIEGSFSYETTQEEEQEAEAARKRRKKEKKKAKKEKKKKVRSLFCMPASVR